LRLGPVVLDRVVRRAWLGSVWMLVRRARLEAGGALKRSVGAGWCSLVGRVWAGWWVACCQMGRGCGGGIPEVGSRLLSGE
jgi:hypothetical protein